jgi:hypothetical protein
LHGYGWCVADNKCLPREAGHLPLCSDGKHGLAQNDDCPDGGP